MKRSMSISLCLVALGSCGHPQGQSTSEIAGNESTQSLDQDSCSPSDAAITSISALIQHLNALAKPVSLNCLLNSMPRPIRMQATSSVISVQPAASRELPRIFLESGGLFLSFVPGEQTLELGETWQHKYSIKGELQFPTTEELSSNAAFVSVGPIFGYQTRCGGPCHGETREYANIGGTIAFASQIIRPNPKLRVSIAELKAFLPSCSLDEACLILESLFREADPVPFEFAEDMPYF